MMSGRSRGEMKQGGIRNILKEIEGKYPVDTVLVNGEQVWPYLRVSYYFQYADKISSEEGEKPLGPSLSFPAKLKRLLNVPYGMKNWLGKYDYIAISTANTRRLISGKYFNVLLDPVIDKLGRGRVLYIEVPAPSLYPIVKIYTDKVVCYDALELLAIIAQVFRLRRYRIENESILGDINKEYGLSVDYRKVIERLYARRMIFRWLFRLKRPKVVLLSWSYGLLQSAIKAANDSGAKVIEFQHGVIGKEHPAYNVYADLDRSYFPDHLAVFGKRELETFRNAGFIEPQHVYPVGNFYIEHIRNSYSPDSGLVKKLENYGRTVGITLQGTTEKRTIEFAVQAANLDSHIFYILIPRRPQEEHYSTLSLPSNVAVIRDKNFYELMAYVDFHSTVYSTCAVEAPSLGVQNILINIDGLSRRYYGTVLTDSRITRYADTPQEFVSTANSFEKLDRDNIVKLNEDLIAVDYERNIEELLRRPPFVE
jgi:hypothetical protein